jgi:GNAT superfamily N-acetyltransferase
MHTIAFEPLPSENWSLFTSLLPLDWRDELRLQWPKNQGVQSVFTLNKNGAIVAGGIVFNQMALNPTTLEFLHGRDLFAAGHLYLGFVWVVPSHRSLGFGAQLLNHIAKVCPKLWLTIEDLSLKSFYIPLGYVEYANTDSETRPQEKLFTIG